MVNSILSIILIFIIFLPFLFSLVVYFAFDKAGIDSFYILKNIDDNELIKREINRKYKEEILLFINSTKDAINNSNEISSIIGRANVLSIKSSIIVTEIFKGKFVTNNIIKARSEDKNIHLDFNETGGAFFKIYVLYKFLFYICGV